MTAHTKGSHTLTAGVYWDKRLNAARRRFTRALESLTRLRKMQAEAESASGGARRLGGRAHRHGRVKLAEVGRKKRGGSVRSVRP